MSAHSSRRGPIPQKPPFPPPLPNAPARVAAAHVQAVAVKAAQAKLPERATGAVRSVLPTVPPRVVGAATQAKASAAPRPGASHVQAAQAKLALGARSAIQLAKLDPKAKPFVPSSPPPPTVTDRRPERERKDDQLSLSNYALAITAITNAAEYKVNQVPTICLMHSLHVQNPGTPIERHHFDISLDGGVTTLHVYVNLDSQGRPIYTIA